MSAICWNTTTCSVNVVNVHVHMFSYNNLHASLAEATLRQYSQYTTYKWPAQCTNATT